MNCKIEIKYKDKGRNLKGKIHGIIKDKDVFSAWCQCSNILLKMNLEPLEINIEEVKCLMMNKEGE